MVVMMVPSICNSLPLSSTVTVTVTINYYFYCHFFLSFSPSLFLCIHYYITTWRNILSELEKGGSVGLGWEKWFVGDIL